MPWKLLRWVASFFGLKASPSTVKPDRKSRSRSRNNIQAGQDLKLKNLEKVLKELECPVCFNTCVPPIYTCLNGHMICTPCRRKNIQCCPTCREGFSGTRNLFAEQFIQQYSQPCRFAKEGCPHLGWKGDDLKPHERACYYRNINCMVPSCQQSQVRYKILLDHLIDTHKIHGSDHIPVLISYHTEEPLIGDRKWLPYYIRAHDCTFYVMMEILRPHFYAWVWVHFPKEEVAVKCDFIATFQFTNEEKKVNMEWRSPVYSIRTPAHVITQEGLCFGVAESLVQHFERDGLMSVMVNIEKYREGGSKVLEGGSVHNLSPIPSSPYFEVDGAIGEERRRASSMNFHSLELSESKLHGNVD